MFSQRLLSQLLSSFKESDHKEITENMKELKKASSPLRKNGKSDVDYEHEIISLRNQVEKLSNDVEKSKSEQGSSEEELQRLRLEFEQEMSEKEAELSECVENNGMLKREKQILQKELAALEVDVVAMTGLREHISSLTVELETVNASLKSQSHILSTEKAKYEVLIQEKESIDTKMDIMYKKCKSLNTELEDVRASLSSADEELKMSNLSRDKLAEEV